jgi:phosphatidate cytidylyltransferase
VADARPRRARSAPRRSSQGRAIRRSEGQVNRRDPTRRRPPPADGGGPGGTRSDLIARLLVAIPAILVVLVVVAQGGWVFAGVIAALGVVCLGELFTMFDRTHPVRLAGFIGIVAVVLAAQQGGPTAVLGALAACIPLVFILGLAQPRAPGAAGISVTILGLTWVGLGLAHAVLLRDLPHGDGIVIDVAVGTFVGDTAAYLGGRAFGSRKLAPGISPNKTVEGLVIGIIGAVLAVWFAGLYQDWLTGTEAVLLGLAIAVTAPLGDLLESYLKRDAGTKDTGTLFGPHGGALDRVDAILFTAVAGYYVWSAMLG